MSELNTSEKKLLGMLQVAELPKKPSYHPGEVCKILDISDRTFWRLVENYEPDEVTKNPIKPYTLDSYTLARSRRVRYAALVLFLSRNNTYERTNACE
jgi:hypothetical protein